MAARDFYSIFDALGTYAPGVVMTRELEASLTAQYQANGFTPLTQPQVLALTGALPTVAPLPRFAATNPSSLDDWSIENRDGAH